MRTNENKDTYVKGNVIYLNGRELTGMEELARKVSELLSKHLPDNLAVHIKKINKINMPERTAVTIEEMDKEYTLSPCIYLENYLEAYRHGFSLETIVSEILMEYERYKIDVTIDLEFLHDFTKVKEYLYYNLMNATREKEFLSQVANIQIYDMGISFYVDLEEAAGYRGYLHVSDKYLELWQATVDDLFEAAITNMQKKYPAEVTSMIDMTLCKIKESVPPEEYEECKEEFMQAVEQCPEAFEMYTCSNKENDKGAAVIFYPDVLKEFAKECQSNFYIIPSSIHECFFVPDREYLAPEFVNNTLNAEVEVNAALEAKGAVLSDYLFYYDMATESFFVVEGNN